METTGMFMGWRITRSFTQIYRCATRQSAGLGFGNQTSKKLGKCTQDLLKETSGRKKNKCKRKRTLCSGASHSSLHPMCESSVGACRAAIAQHRGTACVWRGLRDCLFSSQFPAAVRSKLSRHRHCNPKLSPGSQFQVG